MKYNDIQVTRARNRFGATHIIPNGEIYRYTTPDDMEKMI
jgi:hypothetical protein